MIDYSKLPRHKILCIDMKSFYASCECVLRGLDPLTTHLAVIGDRKISSSVVLAATPKMKIDYGIKTGNRLFEIPQYSHIHIVEARMAQYLNLSIRINRLLNQFAPLEAIHTYSVDEFWICVDGTERLFGDSWQIAEKIKTKIFKQYRLPCCIGIGPNKFLAKVILDIEAKKQDIAECQYEDVPHKLWPQEVEKIWGIGKRMRKNLNRLGILTLGHLAHFPREQLIKKFGIIGEQLYWHAWGVDLSPVKNNYPYLDQKGIGQGITLATTYQKTSEIKTVILELCEEIARRAREVKKVGRTISLGLGYSYTQGKRKIMYSYTLPQPTNITLEIYNACIKLFEENYAGNGVKSIQITLTNLFFDKAIQLSLFEDKIKNHELGYAVDKIRAKYGSTALLRGQSYTSGGVMQDRAKKIGGHRA